MSNQAKMHYIHKVTLGQSETFYHKRHQEKHKQLLKKMSPGLKVSLNIIFWSYERILEHKSINLRPEWFHMLSNNVFICICLETEKYRIKFIYQYINHMSTGKTKIPHLILLNISKSYLSSAQNPVRDSFFIQGKYIQTSV